MPTVEAREKPNKCNPPIQTLRTKGWKVNPFITTMVDGRGYQQAINASTLKSQHTSTRTKKIHETCMFHEYTYVHMYIKYPQNIPT